jgi:hypothetical protein
MENPNKKYSITLDRSIYESNNLNELEILAIDYCINEEYDCFDTKDGDVIKISSIEKHEWEAENIYSLIYDNLIEIDVNVDALDVNDWKFLISELTNLKFNNATSPNDECESIANKKYQIFLPNEDYKTLQLKNLFTETYTEIENIEELIKAII